MTQNITHFRDLTKPTFNASAVTALCGKVVMRRDCVIGHHLATCEFCVSKSEASTSKPIVDYDHEMRQGKTKMMLDMWLLDQGQR